MVFWYFFVRPMVAKVHNRSEKYNMRGVPGSDFYLF